MNKRYIFHNCKLIKVVDGDTFDVLVQDERKGPFGVVHTDTYPIRLRLKNADTAEIYHPSCPGEREFGKRASAFAGRTILNEGRFTIETFKTGKFGRWITTIFLGYNENDEFPRTLSSELRDNHLLKKDLRCPDCHLFETCDKIESVYEKLHLTWKDENIEGVKSDESN